jgi:hypothetical protein
MSSVSVPESSEPRRPRRSSGGFTRVLEFLIEACICVSGWSAILFVFSIFAFVFWEGAPVLFGKLDLIEFFTSKY